MEIDIYEKPTTYENDYRYPKLTKRLKGGNKKLNYEPINPPRPLAECRDNETLYQFRCTAKLPFDLHLKPKEIIETKPKDIIDFPKNSPSLPLKVARPIHNVSPAVSFEEAEELLGHETKDLLTKYTYTTTQQKASEEANIKIDFRKVPKTTLEKTCNPVKFDESIYEPLPLGWKQAGKMWDELQPRCLGNPTERFWKLQAPLIRKNTMTDWKTGIVPEKTLRKVDELAKAGRLRQPHDLMVSGWGGCKIKLPITVPLEKTESLQK